jgi:hypothetical protein
MATYEVTGPDGATYEVAAPDGASEADVLAYAKRSFGQAQAPSAPDPVEGMSRTERVLAGTGKALSDAAGGIKQRWDEAAVGLEGAAGRVGQAINQAVGGPTAAQIMQRGQAEIAETKKRDAALMRDPYAIGGNIGGGMAVGALAAPLGPVGAGAALGFATPTTEGPREVLTNMALGAGSAYAGDKVVQGVSRAIQPRVNPDVKALMREGITPTPGQIMGGNAAKLEAKATSLPFIGDSIAAAQRRAGEQLNRAAFNRALSPLGEKLPAGVQGREAVRFVEERARDAYNKLLPKMSAQADDAFTAEITNLRSMVADGAIDPKIAGTFERIVQNRVLGKFQGQQAMTGETIKGVESYLGKEAARFRRSPDPDVNLLADALDEVQGSLRSLVSRNNPQYAKELGAANATWANFKRVQRAASYLGSDDGVFTPSQLESAVKALDRSKDKSAFARGSALMQDLSAPAKAVMGPKYPDSGTAGRLMNLGGLATALHSPQLLAAPAAGMAMYSPAGQRMMATLLTQRPQAAGLLARQIEAAAPLGGLLGANLALQ